MSGYLSLNGTWQLGFHEEGTWLHCGTACTGMHMMPARVPAPIHQVLQEQGLLDDPNLGLNSLRARWVEEQGWTYRCTFPLPEEACQQSAWLTFSCLEYEATIYLNGEEIGTHANANRPARFPVQGKLHPGDNLLVVALTTGLHSAADKPGAEYNGAFRDLLTKRQWHRKPQYQSGWDWNPRLINVGILGDVTLEWHAAPRLDQVTVYSVLDDDLTHAELYVHATIDNAGSTPVPCTLTARIFETGQTADIAVDAPAGSSRHQLALGIAHPRLWWPVQQGDQYRYTVEFTLQAAGESQTVTRRTGIRKVAIDQAPHPAAGRYFILTINNRPIFCKGGNWVPADLLYSTVDEARTRELVELALRANFNLLRVWGGGCFADHALCDACDEAGMLLWHDFLFACAKYPGDDPAFAAEVRCEVTTAVRDLAHHPSLVVWCGNNEVEWGDWDWGFDASSRTHPHYALFHHDLPLIVQRENPAAAYWISSPYSPEYQHPNDPTVGDQHPWGVSLLDPGPVDFWKYRQYADRFPNEGGMLGASPLATLRQFLPAGERYLLSPSWEHHDNPFAYRDKQPGDLGKCYQTVEFWTGKHALELPLEEYAFYSALLQAEGLQEYIVNYRRRMFDSASAIFWMYNDSWPTSHGWTIIDYYRREKLAYHPVRRAFQPVTVVVAEDRGTVTIYGVNDEPIPFSGMLGYGLFTLDGHFPLAEDIPIEVPANASVPLASFPSTCWEAAGHRSSGAFARLMRNGITVAQHRKFNARFKDLALEPPEITLDLQQDTLTLTSPVFVWGVCLDLTGELRLPDNCFDLLPGIAYTMPWETSLGTPIVVATGNRDAVPAGGTAHR